jgi:uncharacterized GH25 family protein
VAGNLIFELERKMIRFRKMLSIPLVLLLVSPLASAHGIWFAQRAGELALVYGDGAKDDPIVPKADKIGNLRAFDDQGKSLAVGLVKTDHLLLIDAEGDPAMLGATLDNGYFSQQADGKWKKTPKSATPNVKKSGRYYKSAIHQTRDLARAVQPLADQPLQIMPVESRLPLKKGESMALRVLFNGKPLAGLKLATDFVNDPDHQSAVTDAQGMVTIKVPNQGLNVIYATHEVPATTEDADIVQHAATFSFLLKPLAH